MGKIPADAPVIESFVPEGISGKTIYVVMTAAKKVQVMPDFIDTLREKGANVFVFWSENATELFGRDKKPGLASLLA